MQTASILRPNLQRQLPAAGVTFPLARSALPARISTGDLERLISPPSLAASGQEAAARFSSLPFCWQLTADLRVLPNYISETACNTRPAKIASGREPAIHLCPGSARGAGAVPGLGRPALHLGALGNQRTATTLMPDVCSNFHRYRLTRTPTRSSVGMDNHNYFQYSNDGSGNAEWPFGNPPFPILNIAVGGNWGGLMERRDLLKSGYWYPKVAAANRVV
jgi:hypothetical protein